MRTKEELFVTKNTDLTVISKRINNPYLYFVKIANRHNVWCAIRIVYVK